MYSFDEQETPAPARHDTSEAKIVTRAVVMERHHDMGR
jgi:hypothetical protein